MFLSDKQHKYHSYFVKGCKDEQMVRQLIENTFNCKTELPSLTEDVKQHVDFWVIKDNKKYGIDVKGRRKTNRKDNSYNDEIQWIELQNCNGYNGWIYGKSVYIAFLTSNSIILVSRKKLLNFVLSRITNTTISYNNPSECYVPYQRKNRKDIIIKMPTKDLLEIAQHKLPFG